MKVLIGLIGVVVGSVLGAGLAYAQERLRVAAATRGGLRLLAEDLDEARSILAELAAAEEQTEQSASALVEMRKLWLTYRDRLATGLAKRDWESLAVTVRYLQGSPGGVAASSERLRTIDEATSEVTTMLVRFEQRLIRRWLGTAGTRIRAATARPTRLAPGDAPTLGELVFLHMRWRAADAADPELERRYGDALERFELAYGKVIAAFWAPRSGSAVLLTRQQVTGWRALLEGGGVTRMHLETDWALRELPALRNLVHESELEAIYVEELTMEPERAIVLSALLQIVSRLLDYADTAEQSDAAEAALTATARRELREVGRLRRTAAGRATRRAYRFGVVVGVGATWVTAGAVAAAVAALTAHDSTAARVAVAAAAGALGAALSVAARGEADNLDNALGKGIVARLGLFRPLVGSAFALAVFFLFESLFADPLWLAALAGFLAGFAERWARVIVGRAEAVLPDE